MDRSFNYGQSTYFNIKTNQNVQIIVAVGTYAYIIKSSEYMCLVKGSAAGELSASYSSQEWLYLGNRQTHEQLSFGENQLLAY